MKNSPTLCQQFVAAILSPIRKNFKGVFIYHYMDDILIAAQTKEQAQEVQQRIMQAALNAGLKIAKDKIQEIPPWQYLGWKISDQLVQPQRITLQTDIKTLNDLQKLLGTINWVRPLLGISTEELHPLFQLLEGDTDLTSPRKLSPPAEAALNKAVEKLTNQAANRQKLNYPISLFGF